MASYEMSFALVWPDFDRSEATHVGEVTFTAVVPDADPMVSVSIKREGADSKQREDAFWLTYSDVAALNRFFSFALHEADLPDDDRG